jgi:saccharopine dehydrogenase-like NADP-dependent oxidoreductase
LKVAVVGAGAVGARAARQLASTASVDHVLVHDPVPERARSVVASLGDDRAAVLDQEPHHPAVGADAAVLAGPAGDHVDAARRLLDAGAQVVSVSDCLADVRGLLALDDEARRSGRVLAVGAAFSPGFSCLLAAHAANDFDAVDEVHFSRAGTGGPACARQHHRARSTRGVEWRNGEWEERRPGAGRTLSWFPEPIGAEDCYRAGLAEPLLLVPALPNVQRVTARLAANRRERFTAPLPMLRRPHPEAGPGALRVELRGTRAGGRAVHVLGALDRPAVAAGVIAALAAVAAVNGEARRTGAGGLAELFEPLPFLTRLAERGVKAAVFEGG